MITDKLKIAFKRKKNPLKRGGRRNARRAYDKTEPEDELCCPICDKPITEVVYQLNGNWQKTGRWKCKHCYKEWHTRDLRAKRK